MPLGEYRWSFGNQRARGGATLFRFEEYRLPEYKVAVDVPDTGDDALRLGDSIEVEASAEYYFGGAVSDAKVKLIVREAPWQRWSVLRRGCQFRRGVPQPPSQPGRVIREDEIKTGPDGTVRISIDTPIDSPNDLEYTVEARVVDATGREVIGTEAHRRGAPGVFRRSRGRAPGYFSERSSEGGDLRRGRQRQSGRRPRDAHGLARTVARGLVKSTRTRSQGERTRQAAPDVFPPAGQAGWRLQKANTKVEVKRVEVSLGADGRGEYEFTPGKRDFIEWLGADATPTVRR